MPLKIAILEDNDERAVLMESFLNDRFPFYDVRRFSTAPAMIAFLEAHLADVIAMSLDHDLIPEASVDDPGTGRDVVDYLIRKSPVCPIVLHSSNHAAVDGMERELVEAGWETCTVAPFNDVEWIGAVWLPILRNAIVATATAPVPSDRSR